MKFGVVVAALPARSWAVAVIASGAPPAVGAVSTAVELLVNPRGNVWRTEPSTSTSTLSTSTLSSYPALTLNGASSTTVAPFLGSVSHTLGGTASACVETKSPPQGPPHTPPFFPPFY